LFVSIFFAHRSDLFLLRTLRVRRVWGNVAETGSLPSNIGFLKVATVFSARIQQVMGLWLLGLCWLR